MSTFYVVYGDDHGEVKYITTDMNSAYKAAVDTVKQQGYDVDVYEELQELLDEGYLGSVDDLLEEMDCSISVKEWSGKNE